MPICNWLKSPTLFHPLFHQMIKPHCGRWQHICFIKAPEKGEIRWPECPFTHKPIACANIIAANHGVDTIQKSIVSRYPKGEKLIIADNPADPAHRAGTHLLFDPVRCLKAMQHVDSSTYNVCQEILQCFRFAHPNGTASARFEGHGSIRVYRKQLENPTNNRHLRKHWILLYIKGVGYVCLEVIFGALIVRRIIANPKTLAVSDGLEELGLVFNWSNLHGISLGDSRMTRNTIIRDNLNPDTEYEISLRGVINSHAEMSNRGISGTFKVLSPEEKDRQARVSRHHGIRYEWQCRIPSCPCGNKGIHKVKFKDESEIPTEKGVRSHKIKHCGKDVGMRPGQWTRINTQNDPLDPEESHGLTTQTYY